ncbi:MAG: iron-sulfur cluster carrier protein MrpORP [Verrucomicrobiota bacterium]
MNNIKHKILVMSGKGGVGKSTIAVNLACLLKKKGFKTGILDVDIHGPNIPVMLGLTDKSITGSEDLLYPVIYEGMKVMSIAFILKERDDAVIWRGPMKTNVIQQFINQVDWGDLDYLIVDSPPGTGDEPLSVCQTLKGLDGALIVTTPQKVALGDVRKSINFCRKVEVPVLGVVENMSGYICPNCGEQTTLFAGGAGQEMAEQMEVEFMGHVPVDAGMSTAGDSGRPYLLTESLSGTAKAMEDVLMRVINRTEGDFQEAKDSETNNNVTRKIAIPISDGKVAEHFGHCNEFKFLDADLDLQKITNTESETAPPHQPGRLPAWLEERGVDIVLTGGIGERAIKLFNDKNISVVAGVPGKSAEELAKLYLAGTLSSGTNACAH